MKNHYGTKYNQEEWEREVKATTIPISEKLEGCVYELGLLKFYTFLEHKVMGKIKTGDKLLLAQKYTVGVGVEGAAIIPVTYNTTIGRNYVSLVGPKKIPYKMETTAYGEKWYLLPKDFNTNYLG